MLFYLFYWRWASASIRYQQRLVYIFIIDLSANYFQDPSIHLWFIYEMPENYEKCPSQFAKSQSDVIKFCWNHQSKILKYWLSRKILTNDLNVTGECLVFLLLQMTKTIIKTVADFLFFWLILYKYGERKRPFCRPNLHLQFRKYKQWKRFSFVFIQDFQFSAGSWTDDNKHLHSNVNDSFIISTGLWAHV